LLPAGLFPFVIKNQNRFSVLLAGCNLNPEFFAAVILNQRPGMSAHQPVKNLPGFKWQKLVKSAFYFAFCFSSSKMKTGRG